MPTRYASYSEFVSTPYSWVGAMPAHWELRRGKVLFEKLQRPVRSTDGTVTAFRDGEVTLRSNRREDGFTNALKEIGYQGVEPDDLVIHAMDGFAGAIGVSDSRGKCSPVYSICRERRPLTALSKYYASYLRNLALSGFVESLAKGIRERSTDFRFSDFGAIYFPAPSFEEQKTIAAFLDYETAKIDQLIAKQKRLIALLKEKRQAVISHAVTKGLNPNAPMKDSGVEWLGEVPEHWEVRRIKHLAKIQSGKPKGSTTTDKAISVPMLRVANVQDGYVDIENVHQLKIEPNELHRYSLRSGDVLMNEGGDNDKLGRGALWLSEIEPCIHQNHVFAVRCHDLEGEWLTLVTSTSYAKFHFFSLAKQSTNLASISSSNVKETPIVVPPPQERLEIRNHLKRLSKKLNKLLGAATSQIDLLKERRSALISAAVTGKIDVRDWKQPNL